MMKKKMIKDVTDSFSRVIAVINADAQLDTEWFYNNDKIDAVIYGRQVWRDELPQPILFAAI